MQRVIETMGKGEGVRGNSLHVRPCRGNLRENKSSFHDCGSKEPLRGYPHHLDKKILPPRNNDNTPLSFVCPETRALAKYPTTWDSLKSQSGRTGLSNGLPVAGQQKELGTFQGKCGASTKEVKGTSKASSDSSGSPRWIQSRRGIYRQADGDPSLQLPLLFWSRGGEGPRSVSCVVGTKGIQPSEASASRLVNADVPVACTSFHVQEWQEALERQASYLPGWWRPGRWSGCC